MKNKRVSYVEQTLFILVHYFHVFFFLINFLSGNFKSFCLCYLTFDTRMHLLHNANTDIFLSKQPTQNETTQLTYIHYNGV